MKEYKLGSGVYSWMGGAAHEVTFIVTEDCNLRCKYCYQVNKNNDTKMNFEVAKKAVDYLLDNRELFTADGVVWDFIGGEPLLEIELIDKITDYIKLESFKKNHPWFSMFRFNFSTNGILYDDQRVQRYIAKNKGKCNFGITIDGTKIKHDLQRVYQDGRGSYDDVIKNIPLWLKQFPFTGTKVTFASDDLKYLKDSIVHLWDLGITEVPANVVFEDVWKPGDDKIFEEQLKLLADYIIDNKLWNKYDTTLFDDILGTPASEEHRNQNRCGAGMMIAIDGKGNYYPCLRYAPYSLEKAEGCSIGNVDSGLDFDKIRPFVGLTLETQSDEECIDCEIAEGCAWCQGHCYDCTNGETNYTRVKYICEMHKARYRANEYYWNRLREEFNIAREGRNPKSKFLYFIMDDNCVEHCNYTSFDKENLMPKSIIRKGLEFAERNFFTPVILNSKNDKNIINLKDYSYYERFEVYDINSKFSNNNQNKFQVVTKDTITKDLLSDVCLLNLESKDLKNLYSYVKILFEKCEKINLNLKYDNKELDTDLYGEQLSKITSLIYNCYKEDGKIKQFNKLTDDLFNNSMDNCNAGEKTYALAPNGKIYPCPKFYFEDKDSYIGDLENGIKKTDTKIFDLNKSPICSECDIYHCDRCVYLNKKFTSEYNTPSYIQCKISLTEKRQAHELYKKLQEIDENLEFEVINNNFDDPIYKCLESKNIKTYAKDVYTKHN